MVNKSQTKSIAAMLPVVTSMAMTQPKKVDICIINIVCCSAATSLSFWQPNNHCVVQILHHRLRECIGVELLDGRHRCFELGIDAGIAQRLCCPHPSSYRCLGEMELLEMH